jgi:hypothetical protein
VTTLRAFRGERIVALGESRGPLTERLFASLLSEPGNKAARDGLMCAESVLPADAIGDDDLQLALYLARELHYASLAGVDARWEWDPALVGFRATLEDAFLEEVAALVPEPSPEELESVPHTLRRLVLEEDGPPLSRYMEREGTLEQMLEHVAHRSAYQLKEADPHSLAIARLTDAPKVALLEIQFDEYGSGRAERMHSALFARTMEGLGLDSRYGAYLRHLPGVTLATVNLMSCFGISRRWRGAIVGHLAVFEMTSSIPNRRYGNALRRLGYGPEVTAFYDEHVEADSVHEEIAAWDLAGALVTGEPELAADVLFGAGALLALEARWGRHLLDAWESGTSSLRVPLTG